MYLFHTVFHLKLSSSEGLAGRGTAVEEFHSASIHGNATHRLLFELGRNGVELAVFKSDICLGKVVISCFRRGGKGNGLVGEGRKSHIHGADGRIRRDGIGSAAAIQQQLGNGKGISSGVLDAELHNGLLAHERGKESIAAP